MQNKIISKKLCVPPRITAKVWLQSIEMRLLQKPLFIQFISTFLIVFYFPWELSHVRFHVGPGFLKSHLRCIDRTRLFHFVVRVSVIVVTATPSFLALYKLLLQIFPHAQSSISKQAQQLMTMKLELRSP